jgi:hypothetical protein
MKSKLDILVGMSVTNALRVHDYVQLFFERDIVLNIYNEFKLFNGHDLSALNGAKLLEVGEKQDELALYFSNGTRLDIDLRDEAYNGPEALELHVPGQPPVVWN